MGKEGKHENLHAVKSNFQEVGAVAVEDKDKLFRIHREKQETNRSGHEAGDNSYLQGSCDTGIITGSVIKTDDWLGANCYSFKNQGENREDVTYNSIA